MHPFTYHRPSSLGEALAIFRNKTNASFMAGGQTLLPTMKNRLAAPDHLIDLRDLEELQGTQRDGETLIIGAATAHSDVASSPVVRKAIPSLAALADSIADAQVRHQGTLGGSLATNDPAADYPAAILSLDADIITDRRTIRAEDFFTGLYGTALAADEIILRISIPIPEAAGYAKVRSQASRYAVAGSFVTRSSGVVRLAITGAGKNGVFRWTEAEQALADQFTEDSLGDIAPDQAMLLADLSAQADYRAHLVNVTARRAVAHVGSISVD